MVLARIYLKLGVFGLIKLEDLILNLNFRKILIYFFFSGGAVIRILNSFQSDRKRIIAVSSVVHLSMLVGVIFLKIVRNLILLILIIGHRMISYMCFSLNYQIYKKFFSRCIVYFSSIVLSSPIIIIMYITAIVINFSFPGVIRFWGEILRFSVLFNLGSPMVFLSLILAFFVILYSVNIISSSLNGLIKFRFVKDLNVFRPANFYIFIFISFPTIFLFFLF